MVELVEEPQVPCVPLLSLLMGRGQIPPFPLLRLLPPARAEEWQGVEMSTDDPEMSSVGKNWLFHQALYWRIQTHSDSFALAWDSTVAGLFRLGKAYLTGSEFFKSCRALHKQLWRMLVS